MVRSSKEPLQACDECCTGCCVKCLSLFVDFNFGDFCDDDVLRLRPPGPPAPPRPPRGGSGHGGDDGPTDPPPPPPPAASITDQPRQTGLLTEPHTDLGGETTDQFSHEHTGNDNHEPVEVDTAFGPVTVAIVGNRSRPAIVTFHDLGLNVSRCCRVIMLRRLKNNVRSSIASSTSSNDAPSPHNQSQAIEQPDGFLCPMCMVTLPSPDLLQQHYADTHEDKQQRSDSTLSEPTDQVDSSGERDYERYSESESEEGNISSSIDVTDGAHRDSVTSAGAFICPQCFCELPSADELQSHYTALHEVSENRDGDVLAMRLEMNDLRASLNEEKWYATELKKELEKLQAQLMKASQDPSLLAGDDEHAYMQQQIQALEAGKALVTSRMLELEKDNSELKRSVEAVQRDKQRIIEKSATLAKDVVQLKSQLDESEEQKIGLGDEFVKMKQTIAHLAKQLDQRPSEDDVDVLRKELIHAQTLMDTVAREKEQETDEWKRQHENLAIKCAENDKTIHVLQEQLQSMPKSDDIAKLQSSIETSSNQQMQEIERKNDELKVLKEELSQLRHEHQENLDKLAKMDSELKVKNEQLQISQQANNDISSNANKLEQKIQELIENNAKLSSKFEEVNQECEKWKKNVTSTDKKAFDDLQEKDKLVFSLKTQIEQKDDEIKVFVSENEELKNQVASMKLNCDTQRTAFDKIQQELTTAELKIVDLQSDAQKRCDDLGVLLSEKEKLHNSVARLESERTEMLSKMQDGEGSVATALAQLNGEKEMMQKQLEEKDNCHKENIVKLEILVATLKEQIQLEKSAVETDKNELHTKFAIAEKSASTLKNKIEKLENDLKSKKERLAASEKNGEEQRMELEGHLQSLRESLKERSEQTLTMTKEMETLREEMSTKKEQIARMEVMLGDEKQQLSTAIEKLNIAQKKAEEFADRLDATNKLKQELEWKFQEGEKNIDELSTQLAKNKSEAAACTVKESGWNALKAELEAKLKGVCVEVETQQMNKKQFEDLDQKNRAEIERLQAELTKDKDDFQLKERAYREKFETDNARMDSLQHDLTKSQDELSCVGKELSDLKSNFDEITKQKSRMEDQIEKLQSELLVANSANADKSREFVDLEKELEHRTAEINKLTESLAESRTSLEAETTVRTEAEQQIEELKENAAEARHERDSVSQSLQLLGQQMKEKELEVSDCKEIVTRLENELKEEKGIVQDFKEIKTNLEAEMAQKNDNIEELVSTQVGLQKKVAQLGTDLEALQHELKQKDTQFENERKEMDLEKEKLVKDVEMKESALTQAGSELKHFKEASHTLKADLQERLMEVESKLESESKLRMESETEKTKCVAELNAKVETLNERLSIANRDLSSIRDTNETLVTEKEMWESNKNDIESQLSAWSDEKRLLLDKCTSTEKEMERLSESKDFLQRKYDDLMAAVHDLGRSNQSLQIDMSKHIGKQWVDDSQAVNCNHCGKEFSLTIRKHHCRKCGLIFCNDCTTKKASLASSKSAVRVCDECYQIAINTG